MSPTPRLAALAACAAGALPSAQLTLEDVAAAAGVDAPTFGRGAAMVDLDGDGRLDLIAANAGMDNLFFAQKPNHTFEAANALWHVPSDTRQSWGVVAADLDNDGDLDVYFPNGGFWPPEPNQLLRNDLATLGQLTDVSASSGDAPGMDPTFGAAAADLDEDGLLDLFCANQFGSCRVLIGAGGLTFDDRPDLLPGHVPALHRHCGAGDYDNDGRVDVGVGVFKGENRLLRNAGAAGLQDVAAAAGVASAGENFGLVLKDLDQDGWLDVYLPKYQLAPVGPSELYLNAQDGTFVDVTPGSGMTGQDDMGHDAGDLDNDGFAEIYIGTGNPSYEALDLLLRVLPDGAGGLTVTDVSTASGVEAIGLTRNHGMAMGDYDEDGDVDVYANLGGPSKTPATIEANALFRNQGNANAWVEVALEGRISNRGAIGARTKAVLASGREVHAHHQAGRGFGNTPSPIQHLGLGSESALDRIEVRWPSGIVQTLPGPEAFARHALVETGIVMHAQPTIGGSLDVEACGPPLHLVELAFGPNAGALSLGALGTLLLAPPIFPGPSFPLGAEGRETLAIPVPPVPSLSGQTVHLQAWIHPPGPAIAGALTNALTITFH